LTSESKILFYVKLKKKELASNYIKEFIVHNNTIVVEALTREKLLKNVQNLILRE